MSFKEALRDALAARRPAVASSGYTPAAVLVPILEDGLRLLLMERSEDKRDPHSGQISFPGGRREPGDADMASASLREAEEELGISRKGVQILGALEETLTPSGYSITPIVGWLERRPELKPDPREVACAFDVGLEELTDPAKRFSRGERVLAGRRFAVFEYRVGGRVIWGATARIIASLLEAARVGAA